MEVKHFNVYCPKLLAGKTTAELGDTLESRCIPHRAKAEAPVGEGRTLPTPRGQGRGVRASRGAAFPRRVPRRPRSLLPALSCPTSSSDRQQDVWEPLFAIADMAGEELDVDSSRRGSSRS